MHLKTKAVRLLYTTGMWPRVPYDRSLLNFLVMLVIWSELSSLWRKQKKRSLDVISYCGFSAKYLWSSALGKLVGFSADVAGEHAFESSWLLYPGDFGNTFRESVVVVTNFLELKATTKLRKERQMS